MGINLRGSAEYKCKKAEDFPPANDEATSLVVFITHKLPKTGMGLLKYRLKYTKPNSMKADYIQFVRSW